MQINLYEHPNYIGRTVPLNHADPNLDNVDFSNKTSSIVVESGKWQLFDRPNYGLGGAGSVILGPGIYKDAKAIGLPNNSISSLRPFPGLIAETQKEPDLLNIFQGPENADLYIIAKFGAQLIGTGNYTSFTPSDVGVQGTLDYDKHGVKLTGAFTMAIQILDDTNCKLTFINNSMNVNFSDNFPYVYEDKTHFKVVFDNYKHDGYTFSGKIDFGHSNHKCGGAKITPDIEINPGGEHQTHGIIIRPCE